MTCLFVIQFFNTALLILFVNAYLKEFNLFPFMKDLFSNGLYPDLTYEWYTNVGKNFIFTMLINIIQPLISYLFVSTTKGFFRCRDRGCTFNKSKTKTKTVFQYVELYSGPNF